MFVDQPAQPKTIEIPLTLTDVALICSVGDLRAEIDGDAGIVDFYDHCGNWVTVKKI